jgi:hypothetical protein
MNVNVTAILRMQLEEAQEKHRQAKDAFNLIVYNLPTGLPHPDGKLTIEQAGQKERATLIAYMAALQRFSDFILTGKVPADLRRP